MILACSVTKSEYNQRDQNGFFQYRNTILFSNDDHGKDYRARACLTASRRAGSGFLLYQEFVRHLHARRIRYWIMDSACQELGVATAMAESLDDLLKPLDQAFKSDLAQICESHQLEVYVLKAFGSSSPHPGFSGKHIYAIANARGPMAPKTNVARIGLENTLEAMAMSRSCFQIYAIHVAREVEKLHKNRSFSLAWAVRAARFLTSPLMERPVSRIIASDAIATIPYFLVEREGYARAISAAELEEEDAFWTVELHPIRVYGTGAGRNSLEYFDEFGPSRAGRRWL